MKKIIFAALFALTSATAGASEIFGAGDRPCSEWNEERKEEAGWEQKAQWALGYMSAIHLAGDIRMKTEGFDFPTGRALLMVDAYCLDHPDEKMHKGVEFYIREFGKKREKPTESRSTLQQ